MEPVVVETRVHCVLLPCSSGATWAVPLNSIAEIVVAGTMVSGRLSWRGRELPVAPLPAAGHGGGMYAVMLGLQELAGDYWAISLQNRSLRHVLLTEADLAAQDEVASAEANTLAAFALAGQHCLVPDLGALQANLAADPGSLCR